jgi:hypothetical protein
VVWRVVSRALGAVRAGRTNRALEPLKSAPIYHIRVPISDIKGGLEGDFKGSRGRPCGPREPRYVASEIGPDIPYPSSDIRYKAYVGGCVQGLSGSFVWAARTVLWEPLKSAPIYHIRIPISDIKGGSEGISVSFVVSDLVLCCVLVYGLVWSSRLFFYILSSCLVVSLLVVSCLVLSCLVLSCLVLSCLVLSCLVSSCVIWSGLVLSCLVLSCLNPSYLVWSGLVWSCLVLSCLILSCLVLSCLVLSCLVLSSRVLYCIVLSWLDLSCLVLSCFVLP